MASNSWKLKLKVGAAKPQGLAFGASAPRLKRALPIALLALTVSGSAFGLRASIPIGAGALSTVAYQPEAGNSTKRIAIPAGALVATGRVFPFRVAIPIAGAAKTLQTFAPGLRAAIPIAARNVSLVGAALGLRRSISVGSAGITLAGSAYGLRALFPVSSGSLTLVGYGPPGEGTAAIAVPVGALVTATCPYTLVSRIVAGQGALTFSGGALGLRSRTEVPAASLGLTGYGFPLNARLAFAPPNGVAFAGRSPSLASRIRVSSGVLTSAGRGFGLRSSLGIGKGSAAFTRNAPTLYVARLIAVPKATLALTGRGFGQVLRIRASLGHATFTGHEPATAYGSGKLIPAGALSSTGYAPTLARRIHVDRALSQLLGNAAYLNLQVAGGRPATLSLAGTACGLRQGYAIAAAELVFDATVPGVYAPIWLYPGTGSLAFDARAPRIILAPTGSHPEVTLSVEEIVLLLSEEGIELELAERELVQLVLSEELVAPDLVASDDAVVLAIGDNLWPEAV